MCMSLCACVCTRAQARMCMGCMFVGSNDLKSERLKGLQETKSSMVTDEDDNNREKIL